MDGPAGGGLGVAGHAAVLLGQIVHGVMDASQLSAGHLQRPRLPGPQAQADGVEHAAQVAAGDVLAHRHARLELGALGHHLLQAAVEDVFFQLEIGNAVAQQAAQPVVFLENHDLMPGAGELLGGGQPRGPRADDRHLLARAVGRPQRPNPSLPKRPLGNLVLDVLDGDRLAVDRQRARGLAGGRAHPAGDLRKIVGRMEVVRRLAPPAPVHQIVELGNAVLHRAARGMAKRDAAVHAPRRLLVQHPRSQGQVDLPPVADALFDRPVAGVHSRILDETRRMCHV